ncbi:DNA excision repair protein ERCC-6-like [Dorcoceras hygrometricum]|uniref:DNA excision repair protein ERCC-6-like n=1 Tax=Dorcoceras hygrometricum TaxID=472368 RepID=A0A2Z7BLT9_9LAMI|nr:DNA excision repair protein ERCC-6-like [Dorcoceras hygrometricum]
MTHDMDESIEHNDQISGKMNHESKNGFEYVRPENNKPSWLRNRLVKVKAHFETSVPNQQRRGSMKAKSGWKKVHPQRNLNGQTVKSNHNKFHNISARTLVDTHTRRTVKVIQTSHAANLTRNLDTQRNNAPRDLMGNVDIINLTNDDLCSKQISPGAPIHSRVRSEHHDAITPQSNESEQEANPMGSDLRWNRIHPPEQIIATGALLFYWTYVIKDRESGVAVFSNLSNLL